MVLYVLISEVLIYSYTKKDDDNIMTKQDLKEASNFSEPKSIIGTKFNQNFNTYQRGNLQYQGQIPIILLRK